MDRDELMENFEHFDRDHNGKIDLAEFSELLDALGSDMNDGDKRIGFDAIDTDGSKAIDFDEFATWWADKVEDAP
jgi:Ca2+-binding EF-hand superfamily protein